MPSNATSMLDGLSTSVAVKAPCATVATTNITLAGLQTVNGVVLVDGDRVLCVGQTSAVNNGIYNASSGSWSRALDADGNRDFVCGTRVLVRSATIGVEYELITSGAIVVGTSSLTFQLRYGANATFDQSAIEIAAGVTPTSTNFGVLDPRRYVSTAQWTAVYTQVNTLAESYDPWYRLDRAQHPTLTNCIVGFGAYNDSQQTGTNGYRCTVFGAFAMSSNHLSTNGGGSNAAFGYFSQASGIDTSGNSSFGNFSLQHATGVVSAHNGAFGYECLAALVTGTQNNGHAYRCMYQLVTGNNNCGYGDVCLQGLLVGGGNTCYGFQSNHAKVAGDYSHAFGYQALFSEQSAVITGISKAASAVVTVSTVSVINPFSIGQPVSFVAVVGMTQINTLTGFVTAIGGASGAWTVTVAINSAGFSTYTSGGYLCPHGNSAFGYNTGFNTFMRGGGTFFGAEVASAAEAGYGCSLFGFQCGQIINANGGSSGGELNSGFGFWSIRQLTIGAGNAAFGNRSLENLVSGSSNVGVGSSAGDGVTTASKNAWLGVGTSINLNGDFNSGVGFNAGKMGSAQTYTNVTCLGANTTVTGANQLQLGDSGTTSYAYGALQNRSDIRDKADVRDCALGLDFINALRPVDYRWDFRSDYAGEKDGTKKRTRFHHGLIAQDVKNVMDKLGVDFGGYQDHKISGGQDVLSLGYEELIAPLIKSVQELSREVTALRARLAA